MRVVPVIAIAAMLISPADAQQPPPCGPRQNIIAQLEQDFGEVPHSLGVAGNGTLLELLVSASGTWTMLITLPNGNSCFGASGEMWQPVTAKPSGKGA